MKKIMYFIFILITYVLINYGIYADIGWVYAEKVFIPISLSTIFWFYVLLEVIKNPEEGMKSRVNISLVIASIALFVLAFFTI